MTNDRCPRDPARVQRPQREADPRARRSVALALLGATLAVAAGLGVTALRVHQVQLAYRLDAARAERVEAERLLQQLEVEIATLRSPGRVESRARQIGLVAPAPGQVRLAREYVPSVNGAAAGNVAAIDPGRVVTGASPVGATAVVR